MRAGAQPLVCGSVGRKSKETATGRPPAYTVGPRVSPCSVLRHLRHPGPQVWICVTQRVLRASAVRSAFACRWSTWTSSVRLRLGGPSRVCGVRGERRCVKRSSRGCLRCVNLPPSPGPPVLAPQPLTDQRIAPCDVFSSHTCKILLHNKAVNGATHTHKWRTRPLKAAAMAAAAVRRRRRKMRQPSLAKEAAMAEAAVHAVKCCRTPPNFQGAALRSSGSAFARRTPPSGCCFWSEAF